MPEFSLCHQADSAVVQMQTLEEERIGFATAEGTVHLFDAEACRTLSHFKIQEYRPQTPGDGVFSFDGRWFAFAHHTDTGYVVRIVDTDSKAPVRSYAVQDNPVELLCFDPTGQYIIAGTSTGRVFLWRTDGHNLLARLSSFPEYTPSLLIAPTRNYVSAAAFEQYRLATSGYGGSIVVTNVKTQANTRRLRPGKSRIDTLLFLDEHRLIAGNADGIILLLHTEDHHPTRRIGTGIGPIKHLALLPNRHFLLAASIYEHIALIDIDAMEVLDNRYIVTESPITSLTTEDDHTVLIGQQDGRIVKADLSPFAEFNALIASKRYVDAYAMSEREPIIKKSAEFEHLEVHFKLAFETARRLLSEESREEAGQALAPFLKVPSKSRHIRDLITAFDHYPRLKHVIAEKKYSVAYGLATQFPHLRHSPAYRALEEEWDRAFVAAQKQVLRGQEAQAKQTLLPFLTVPEKSPYIRMLLHNKATLFAFAKAIGAKDYTALKKLTEREPILRDTPSYRNVMESSESIIEVIMAAIKEGAFEKAELLCDELRRIPHLSRHYESIQRFIDKAEQLDSLYAAGALLKCYELLDRSAELLVLPLAQTIEEAWQTLITDCEAAALQGNSRKVKALLGDLLLLKSRNEKIGNILRASYQMQIKHLISKEQFDTAAEAITRYLDLFGMDNETQQLVQILNQKSETPLELSEAHLQFRARSLWQTKVGKAMPDRLW
jgi:WD40 repeat protein